MSCFSSTGSNEEEDNTYYLVTKDKTCLVGTDLGEHLDLVCQHYDRGPPDAKSKLCSLRLSGSTFIHNPGCKIESHFFVAVCVLCPFS